MGAESLGFVKTLPRTCQATEAPQTTAPGRDLPGMWRFVSLCKLPGHLGMLAAQSPHMTGIRFASLVVLAAASGCAVGNAPPPAYPQQMAWTGPPGGAIDEGYGYQYDEGDGSYEGSYPPDGDDPTQPSADPADPNYAFGDVSDVEIDATLEASGEWIEDEDYGRVWLPYTTVVGGDFTPYDSSGDWVYTDAGWSFQSDFDWGWLAFHFGRWTMFDDDRWGWVPDHTWGASWCDWRHDGNNNVVGWRPQAPSLLRDHRTGASGGGGGWASTGGHATIRDHRTHGSHKEPNWRFARVSELVNRSRSLQLSQVDGLRSTQSVSRPPAGQLNGRASALMGGRLRGRGWAQTHPTTPTGTAGTRPWRGGPALGQSTGGGRPWMQPRSPWNGNVRGGPQATRNEWRSNGRDWRPTQRDWRPQQRPTIDDGRGRTFGTRPEAGGGSRMWPRAGDTYPGATNSRGSAGDAPNGEANGWGDRGSPSGRPTFDGGSRGSPNGRPSFDGSNGSRPTFDGGSRGSPSSRPSWGGGGSGSRPTFDGGGSRGAPSAPPSWGGGSRGGGSSGGSRPSPSSSGGSSGGGRSAPSSSAGSSSSGSSRGSSSSSSSSSSGSSRSSGGGSGRHR